MERQQRPPALLNRLARLTGCDYLSDLRDIQNRPALRRAVEQILPEEHPTGEWGEAMRYLFLKTPFIANDADWIRCTLLQLLSDTLQDADEPS